MKSLEKIVFLLSILLFIGLGYISFFNVYQTDDYIFSFFTRNGGAFRSVVNLYFNWGGRYFGYFINLLNPLSIDPKNILPKIYPPLLMSLFIMVVSLNIWKFFKYPFWKSLEKGFVFFFFYTILLVKLPEHYFWITGSNIYFLPVIFCGLLIFSLEKHREDNNRVWLLISSLLIVLAIGSNEVIALIVQSLLVMNYFYKKEKPNLYLLIVSTVCFLISFLAPGNFNRMVESSDSYLILWGKRILFSGTALLYLTLKSIMVLPLFVKIFEKEITQVMDRVNPKTPLILWGISILPLFFLAYLLYGIGRHTENMMTYYFLVCACITVFYKFKIQKIWWISVFFVILPKFYLFPDQYSSLGFNFYLQDLKTDIFQTNLKEYDEEIEQRIKLITTDNSDSVTLPKIKTVPKLLYFDELSGENEPKRYVNDQLEKYFNKKSVIIKD